MRPTLKSRWFVGAPVVLLLALALLAPLPARAQGEGQQPVVYALLLYSPSCPHCHDFIENGYPSMREEFGDQFQLLFINVQSEQGHAIAQAATAKGYQPVYSTAESFTNDLVGSIRSKTMDEFRAKYRGARLLIIDDFEFIAGKTSTEEEFFHTFNAVLANQGQIVVACSAPPRAIAGLDVRLRARLEGGLLADLQAPDYETRLKIVRSKAVEQGVTLPPEVAECLAGHEAGNVCEIEGLLTQVTARATLAKQPLTTALAEQALNRTAAPPPRRKANVRDILEATATFHQLSLDDLLSKRRTKEVVRARHIAMYLAREETEASLPQIGEALGGRNHSTVLHGYQKIAGELGADEALRQELNRIREQLYQLPN